jgi:cobalt-zinc-cadmium efflux system protein
MKLSMSDTNSLSNTPSPFDSHPHSHSSSDEHEHDHSHGHGIGHHHHHGPTQGAALWWALILTTLFFAFELSAGFYSNSLALISDAWHNFSDALALGLAGYAVWIARKPANSKRTFGYHRVAILTALINAATLIFIAIVIIVQAVQRYQHPVLVDSSIMFAVAIVAVILNTVIAAILHNHASANMNVRAAYLHMATDALSGIAGIIAAALYRWAHWQQADVVISALIGVFILWSSWDIVRDATNVLLEAVPQGLDVESLVKSIRTVKGVVGLHDLHVWTVADGMNFMSCHLEVESACTLEEMDQLLILISARLEKEFGVNHATLQFERVGTCVSALEGDGHVYCGDHVIVSQTETK